MCGVAVTWPDLLPRIFRLYDNDRVVCAFARQKLADLAAGTYHAKGAVIDGERFNTSLEDIAARASFPRPLNKENPWRTRYSELEFVPVREWPADAYQYASDDGLATEWSLEWQERTVPPDVLVDEFNQARHDFVLRLVSNYGLRTDPEVVQAYADSVERRVKRDEARLLELGLIRATKLAGTYSRNTKVAAAYAAQAYAAAGMKPPTTPTGNIKLDEDSCNLLGDEILLAYQGYGSAQTARSKPLDLAEGLIYPIHTNYDALIATGRTSSSKPNVQNRGTEPGDRECVVPRPGYVFCDSDYDGLELRTFAQVCLWSVGFSKLAEVLNADGDPHSIIAAQLLSIPLEEALKRKKNKADFEIYNARQTGKVVNFGGGGGIGWRVLIVQARAKYGVKLNERQAKNLLAIWRETWPEVPRYFAFIEDLCRGSGRATVRHFQSGRYRAGIPYTECCNTFFQGLGADAAKNALYALVRECYVGNSVLNQCRVVNFVHDEFITEMPEEIAHECALEKTRIVEGIAQQWVPDLRMTCPPTLTRRWSKLADTVKDPQTKRLVPWELTMDKVREWNAQPDAPGITWLGEAVQRSRGCVDLPEHFAIA
jgi:hypothetical protein